MSTHVTGQGPIYKSTKAACQELGVGRDTLYAWARRGAISYYRTPGGHFRWNVADFLASQSRAA